MLRRSSLVSFGSKAQRGLSIVELLVGVAVGLFIIGGAAKLFVDYLVGARNSLLEVRLNQDLRAAADLVVRDLRRAGYWRNSATGVWSTTTTSVATNPYTTITPASSAASSVTYNYDKDGVDVIDAGGSESFGFQLTAAGVLQVRLGSAGYQDLTDANSVKITTFTVTPANLAAVELYQTCPCLVKGSCTLGEFQNPNPATGAKGVRFDTRPLLNIQEFTLRISGEAASDSRIKRDIVETVRVRNDRFSGSACVT